MARSIDKGNRLPKNDGISINNGNLSCKSVMNSFYHCAFSQTPSERDDELKVFRVFIGRRSFVKAFLYIQEHQIDEKICETVYSDVGFRVLAAKLGAEFVKAFTEKQIDNFFNNRVFLYDDILIHGRALSGLLSAAEEIFISSFEQAAPKGLALPRDVLSAIFLSIVTIKTAVQNNQAILLPRRFKMTHDKGSSKKMNPCSWRRFSSEIAEEIYNSGIPNAAFMPGVLFDENSGFRQMLSERFRGLSEQGLLLDFGFSETAYRGRNMDSYISFQFEEDSLLAVFTIRCTDKYLIPFVFLPGISDKQFSLLTKHISDRIKLYSLDLGKLTEELFDEYRLQVSPYLNVFYSELVNMIHGTALLRSFLNVLGIQIQDSEYNLSTTKALMMSNYAHKSVINELFRLMFDESLPPLYSLKELRRLLVDTTEKKSCIFSEISDITDKDSDDAATCRDDPCASVARNMKFLMEERRADFMHRDGGCECGERKQRIEKDRDDIADNRHGCECLMEHVGQRDEDERGPRVGRHTDGESRRENHQSCKDGDDGVDEGNLHRRAHQARLLSEIGGVGAQACRAKGEREESLSERFEEHAVRHLSKVGLEEELHPLDGSRQHARSRYEQEEQDEERGHEQFGCLFDAIAHPPGHHQVGDADERHGPHDGFPRVGSKLLEIRHHIIGVALEMPDDGCQEVLQAPPCHDGIEAEDDHGGEHAQVSDDPPWRAPRQFVVRPCGIGGGVTPHDKLSHHAGFAKHEHANRIDEDEGRPAVHPGHIGEAPDVSQSHR